MLCIQILHSCSPMVKIPFMGDLGSNPSKGQVYDMQHTIAIKSMLVLTEVGHNIGI